MSSTSAGEGVAVGCGADVSVGSAVGVAVGGICRVGVSVATSVGVGEMAEPQAVRTMHSRTTTSFSMCFTGLL
jgi:hypothetical protein